MRLPNLYKDKDRFLSACIKKTRESEPSENGDCVIPNVKHFMIKVKNINGSGFYHGVPAGCTSWLDYWEKTTGKKARKCGACGKTTNLVGAREEGIW